MNELRVGVVLDGFCGGCFGRDSYDQKRVEAIGADWVVARELGSGQVVFHEGDPQELVEFAVPTGYDRWVVRTCDDGPRCNEIAHLEIVEAKS